MVDDSDDGRRDAAGQPAPADGDFGARVGTSAVEPTTTRTGATSPRPRKRSPLGLVFDDLGLKVVALVLAITTWILVHDQIQDHKSVEGIAVVPFDLPPNIRANFANLPRLTVRLTGTAAAVERARAGLEQSGRPVRLKTRELRGDEGHATFRDRSDFNFPFADVGVVESITPAVRVDWYRVDSQEIEFTRPRIDIAGRTDLEIVAAQSSVEPGKVLVTGPVNVIEWLRNGDLKLALDDVSAAKWLRESPDFATPFSWSSGFADWRSRAPELRAEWALTIEPPTVSGKTKYREYKVTTTQVELALLYPAGLDARAYEKYDIKFLDTAYDARTRRLEVSLRGDPQLVAALGAGQSGWTLLVSLPAPPKDDSGSVESYSAAVMLVPPEGAAGDATPRLRLVSPSKVFVTLEKRKGP